MNGNRGKKRLNWKQKIVRDLERVENLLPEPNFMQDDWPDWARQMGAEFWKAAVPGIGPRHLYDPTAHDLGRMVGAKQAGLIALTELRMPKDVERAFKRLLRRSWGKKSEILYRKQVAFLSEKYFPKYVTVIFMAVITALTKPQREQADFFRGFAEMVRENPNTRSTSWTNIYWFMIFRWREIEEMESVTQLHDVLCKIFGSHLVGDRKRIEKICGRKGLHFRGRGRPAQLEKSDTQPA